MWSLGEEYVSPKNWGRCIKENKMTVQQSDKILWLAKQIFTSFPQHATGLKFYTMDCGCMYCLRVSRDGVMDYHHVAAYRDEEDSHCEACMDLRQKWGDRVVDETVVYNTKFQIG
jgi:hypothetical protein